MQQVKAALQKEGIKPVKEVKHAPDPGVCQKRIPTDRLLMRLDIKRFDSETELIGEMKCSNVYIPLKMHIGGPDEPVVSTGMYVHKGELIARPKGMGANIHASISGQVVSVTDEYIQIRE